MQKNATQAQKTMARWVCLSLHEVGATFFLCPVELLMVKVILSQGDTAKKNTTDSAKNEAQIG